MGKYNVNLSGPLLAGMLVILAGCAHSPAQPQTAQAKTPPSSQAATTIPATSVTTQRQQPPLRQHLRDDAPLRYVVKKGDTLWDIAGYFLDDPWYWPELWYANPKIANPHLIYPGEVLYLVWVNGKPQLRRHPGKRLEPRIRREPLSAAINTIPLDAIRQFLNGPRLVSKEELEQAPYILQFLDNHIVGGAGNQVYVRGTDATTGPVYSAVKPGPAYRDPDTNEILGYQAAPVGVIKVNDYGGSADNNVSTGVITRSFREAEPGDRLLPFDDTALASDFYPRAPDIKVDARIISVYGGVSQIGQYQIVTLNRGARNGIKRGYVLDVYQTGRRTTDPITGERVTLPAAKAGTLMVFKVAKRVSYGLIMRATRAIHKLDSARNPDS